MTSAAKCSEFTGTVDRQIVAGNGKAFGMNILGWPRAGLLNQARSDRFAARNKERLNSRLIEATRGIVRRRDVARMKSTALLVKTRRAGLIEPAVIGACAEQGNASTVLTFNAGDFTALGRDFEVVVPGTN